MENLLIKSPAGELTINPDIENLLDTNAENIATATQLDKDLRSALLNAMIENGIFTAHVGKYTISQVIPKDIVTFDKNAFIAGESVELIDSFATVETQESFDLERFKSENPELYEKYLIKDQNVVIDEKKLSKKLPTIFDKYSTRVKSDKAVTLKINKGGKE